MIRHRKEPTLKRVTRLRVIDIDPKSAFLCPLPPRGIDFIRIHNAPNLIFVDGYHPLWNNWWNLHEETVSRMWHDRFDVFSARKMWESKTYGHLYSITGAYKAQWQWTINFALYKQALYEAWLALLASIPRSVPFNKPTAECLPTETLPRNPPLLRPHLAHHGALLPD